MSLRDKLNAQRSRAKAQEPYARFGVLSNPFPTSSQTSNNPRCWLPVDDEAEARVVSFLQDRKSQVVVVEGTQGVGKTNFLNYFEKDIKDAIGDLDGYYIVRYLADPEASFEGTIRRLFQELGTEHLRLLAEKLRTDSSAIEVARGQEMRSALYSLIKSNGAEGRPDLLMDWLLGLRLLRTHRESLDVQFRLDTVESKTGALRDLVLVSSEAGTLKGIFLLLDELEKQEGVLGPKAIVRYLLAMRAIIDALPNHLFMMIAITPDALRRYSAAVPAFRSRLQNPLTLTPLNNLEEATALAQFYIETARVEAKKSREDLPGTGDLITKQQVEESYEQLRKLGERRGDTGVRQREFLHQLHMLVESVIHGVST